MNAGILSGRAPPRPSPYSCVTVLSPNPSILWAQPSAPYLCIPKHPPPPQNLLALPVPHCPADEVELSGQIRESEIGLGLPHLPALKSPQGDSRRLWGAAQLPLRQTHNPEGPHWKGVVLEPLMRQTGFSHNPQPPPLPGGEPPDASTQPIRSCLSGQPWARARARAWLTSCVMACKLTPPPESSPLLCKIDVTVPPRSLSGLLGNYKTRK